MVLSARVFELFDLLPEALVNVHQLLCFVHKIKVFVHYILIFLSKIYIFFFDFIGVGHHLLYFILKVPILCFKLHHSLRDPSCLAKAVVLSPVTVLIDQPAVGLRTLELKVLQSVLNNDSLHVDLVPFVSLAFWTLLMVSLPKGIHDLKAVGADEFLTASAHDGVHHNEIAADTLEDFA